MESLHKRNKQETWVLPVLKNENIERVPSLKKHSKCSYMRFLLPTTFPSTGKKNKAGIVVGHTIKRFPMFSSESVQGWTENGLFNCTDLGGNEYKKPEAQNFYSATHEISKLYQTGKVESHRQYKVHVHHNKWN